MNVLSEDQTSETMRGFQNDIKLEWILQRKLWPYIQHGKVWRYWNWALLRVRCVNWPSITASQSPSRSVVPISFQICQMPVLQREGKKTYKEKQFKLKSSSTVNQVQGQYTRQYEPSTGSVAVITARTDNL